MRMDDQLNSHRSAPDSLRAGHDFHVTHKSICRLFCSGLVCRASDRYYPTKCLRLATTYHSRLHQNMSTYHRPPIAMTPSTGLKYLLRRRQRPSYQNPMPEISTFRLMPMARVMSICRSWKNLWDLRPSTATVGLSSISERALGPTIATLSSENLAGACTLAPG